MKKFRLIVSMILCLTLLGSASMPAFAAENTISSANTTYSNDNFHKTNGVYCEGGGATFYTTITKECSTLKIRGVCYGNQSTTRVTVVVYFGDTNNKAASGTIYLNGNYYTLTAAETNLTPGDKYPVGTYRVVVTPFAPGDYEVSSYFYI